MKRLLFMLGRAAFAGDLALSAAGGAHAGIPPITDGEGRPKSAIKSGDEFYEIHL